MRDMNVLKEIKKVVVKGLLSVNTTINR